MTKSPRKQPILNDGVGVLSVVVVILLIVFAVCAAVYFDGAPNPKEPKCDVGEAALFNKDGWVCVPARKP